MEQRISPYNGDLPKKNGPLFRTLPEVDGHKVWVSQFECSFRVDDKDNMFFVVVLAFLVFLFGGGLCCVVSVL